MKFNKRPVPNKRPGRNFSWNLISDLYQIIDLTKKIFTSSNANLSPVHVVLLFFYYSFFITRFLYLFLKVTAFFKVVGSNPGWGNFFIFFYFSIIFSIKNCVENIKGTFYSNFINTWFQVISNYYYLKSIVKWTLNKNCLLCFQHSFWWRIW